MPNRVILLSSTGDDSGRTSKDAWVWAYTPSSLPVPACVGSNVLVFKRSPKSASHDEENY
eukprot:scaffold127480_cov13-Tisochrysis_lutea.AAC.1